ncbi:MAG TPA: MBL fold metallo-hydrolase [Candidatus Limnocylindria bacterium]|nr:MBL fold metallo-hydrolase [Candidatus Limnocylindria bacterium]
MGAARAALHFLGHSTALVDIDGTRILTDPLLVSGLGPIRRRPHATHDGLQGITPDAVVISHAHHDHLHLPSLRRLVGRPPLIVPAGLGRLVARDGHDVTEISPGERLRVGGLTIEATQALHHPGRGPLGPAAIAIGFRIAGSTRVYFAGDTDLFPGMRDLAGSVDVALLPVWGWGPTIGAGHLDPLRAAQAVTCIRPRLAVPIHWGTFYPLGLARFCPRPLERPPLDFAEEVARIAPATDVRVLAPGDRIELSAS